MTDATLVYDDDCGFCTWWAEFVADRSDVGLVGFSQLDDDTRARLPADYESCVHFLTDGAVRSCGAAMEAALTRTDLGEPGRPVVDLLGQFEEYRRVRERGYRWVADNRDVFGQLLSKTPPTRRSE